MDTPYNDTDWLRTSHSARKVLLATVLSALLVGSAVGLALSQQTYDLNEGFEDGDINIEYANWDGWQRATDQLTASQEYVISGTYSGAIDVSTGNAYRVQAFRTQNTTTVGKVEVKMAINETSGGRFGDVSGVQLFGSNNRLTQVGFSSSGDIEEMNDVSEDTIISNYDPNTVYTVTWHNWDFDAQTVNITVEGGGQSATILEFVEGDNLERVEAYVEADGGDRFSDHTLYFDDYIVQTQDRYSITGQLTNQDGDEIRDATVEATDSNGNTFTDDVNRTGHYAIEGIGNETYNVTTKAPGYINESADVTIAGSSETQDFQLLDREQTLRLDTRLFLEHGETTPYTVTATYIDNGLRVRENVTGEASVSSNDTNVVTVDQVNQEIVATDDITVNNRTFLEATWDTPDGDTLTTQQNITVANKTVENLDILPPVTRFGASIEDKTIQTIFIATGVGVAAAILAGAFAGIAGISLIMLMGWVIGIVGNGMIIVTLLTAMFIGMNVAGNVDYTVRR